MSISRDTAAERTAKLSYLLYLCLGINGIEKREPKFTGSKPTVFYYIAGHTAAVDIEVFETGWTSGSDPDFEMRIFFDTDFDPNKYAECIRYLEGISDKENAPSADQSKEGAD